MFIPHFTHLLIFTLSLMNDHYGYQSHCKSKAKPKSEPFSFLNKRIYNCISFNPSTSPDHNHWSNDHVCDACNGWRLCAAATNLCFNRNMESNYNITFPLTHSNINTINTAWHNVIISWWKCKLQKYCCSNYEKTWSYLPVLM